MTTADGLRQRARQIEDHAWSVRWDHPREYHQRTAIARELTEMAAHLPPERTEP